MYFTRGVPGVIFALGSCGAATLRLHGPVGLRGFLGAIRSFVRRKYPQIACVEITAGNGNTNVATGCDSDESMRCETWAEGEERTDQHALIIPIALGSKQFGRPQSCMLCEKNAPKRRTQESFPANVNSTSNVSRPYKVSGDQSKRRRENESDEHEQWREWLLRYCTVKVPSKVPYIDVVLNRYRGHYADLKAQLCAKYGDIPDDKSLMSNTKESPSSQDSSSDSESDREDNDDTIFSFAEKDLDRRWLEKFYEEYQPNKLPHIDRVLRQFSGREDTLKQMLLKKYGDNTTASGEHSDGGAPTKKRKLLDTLETSDATPRDDPIPKIYASERQFDDKNSPLPDYPSSSLCYVLHYIKRSRSRLLCLSLTVPCGTFESNERAKPTQVKQFLNIQSQLVLTTLQFLHCRYKHWMANLSSKPSGPEHLVFDGAALQAIAGGAFSYAFVSSAKVAVRRELESRSVTFKGAPIVNQVTTPAMLNLVNFLQDSSWSDEHPCRRQVVKQIGECENDLHIAQSKLQFSLLHPKGLQIGFDYQRTGWHQRSTKDQNEDEAESVDNQLDERSSGLSQRDIVSSRKLIVLGTGSAAPSKLRASSGMYLELSGTDAADVESMLVDCGEGTFGQLWRQFGDNITQRIGGLRCMGAELLVHEATFDDSMEEDAKMKKHSTVGQALSIAQRMRARQVVLTHFSQRYPSLPPPVLDSSEGANATDVLCAFDGFVHPMPF
ncbi:unnamed protein product [Phytophthora lilii]|uniref:ribonuclease Z n=1 Tax=Phytophthora lilii TaxID=2077276 RepID=A0A9W6WPS0_9STRA|nr:unnamed protein product [Phytophthora lilii]